MAVIFEIFHECLQKYEKLRETQRKRMFFWYVFKDKFRIFHPIVIVISNKFHIFALKI